MRVLIVDDEVRIRVGLVRLLARRGFTTDQAGTATEARELLSARAYDAVLLDWQLPDETGIDLCSFIRNVNPEAHVMMLTAREEPADRLRAFDAGVDDYVVKQHIDLEEIAVRLRAVARRRPMAARSA